MFVICVFRKSGYCRILNQYFFAHANGFVSWHRIKHGKLFKNVSRWNLDPTIRFSLDAVIQADTPIKQCCNFSRYFLALETDKDMSWFMSKQEIIALSGVVHKVNNTGPCTEHCGTPYESVTLSFLRICAYFSNKKKTKFESAQIFHTNLQIYLSIYNVAWLMVSKTAEKSKKVRTVTYANFFETLRKCRPTSFHWNVDYVNDGSYQYVNTIFQHTCRNRIQITWFLLLAISF